MGDRAIIIFENEKGTRRSPVIYLHWCGNPGSVYAFLDELTYRQVRADQEYEAARLVQIIGEYFDKDGYTGYSLGISDLGNRTPEEAAEDFGADSNNGLYLVCREGSNRRVKRYKHGEWLDDTAVDHEDAQAYQSMEMKRITGVWSNMHGTKKIKQGGAA